MNSFPVMLLFQLTLLVHFPSFGLNYIIQYTVGTDQVQVFKPSYIFHFLWLNHVKMFLSTS